MPILIESNIPIPRPKYGRPIGELFAALESMEVGQSIVLDAKHRGRVETLAVRRGVTIATRLLDDRKHIRVWLVSTTRQKRGSNNSKPTAPPIPDSQPEHDQQTQTYPGHIE